MATEYQCFDCGKILRREEVEIGFNGCACSGCGGRIVLLSSS